MNATDASVTELATAQIGGMGGGSPAPGARVGEAAQELSRPAANSTWRFSSGTCRCGARAQTR